jgi:hypothetical protein
LSVNEILRGQWLALLRQFGAAVALVCAVDFVFLGLGLKQMSSDRSSWISIWLAGIAIFVLDLVTLTLVAMWLSLRSRKSSQAGLSAIVQICIVPWFLFAAFGACLAILNEAFHVHPFDSGNWGIGIWFAISLATDVLLGSWALRNLRSQFRLTVTQRLESRRAFWGRWLGRKFRELRK